MFYPMTKIVKNKSGEMDFTENAVSQSFKVPRHFIEEAVKSSTGKARQTWNLVCKQTMMMNQILEVEAIEFLKEDMTPGFWEFKHLDKIYHVSAGKVYDVNWQIRVARSMTIYDDLFSSPSKNPFKCIVSDTLQNINFYHGFTRLDLMQNLLKNVTTLTVNHFVFLDPEADFLFYNNVLTLDKVLEYFPALENLDWTFEDLNSSNRGGHFDDRFMKMFAKKNEHDEHIVTKLLKMSNFQKLKSLRMVGVPAVFDFGLLEDFFLERSDLVVDIFYLGLSTDQKTRILGFVRQRRLEKNIKQKVQYNGMLPP